MTTTAPVPHISDIRVIMAEQLRALRNATPQALESELKRSKAVSELSQTMINSAKVEIDYLQVTKQNHSPFLEVPPTVHTGNTPVPLQNTQGIALGIGNDDKVQVTRTTWADVATKDKRK
jgi:hypothetical protein